MHPARIAELLHPFLSPYYSEAASAAEESASLTSAQLQDISIYINLLLRWNAHINLTAIRDPREIVTRHFGESLFAARHLFPANAWVGPGLRPGQGPASAEGHSFSRAEKSPIDSRAFAPQVQPGSPSGLANHQPPRTTHPPDALDLIDIGAGAGFPGLPIKLWAPHLRLTLIESNQKKATFLREVIRSLRLMDIDVSLVRAESFPQQASVVTLRAVERFDSVLPIAARLVAPSGRLALLIARPQVDRAIHHLPTLHWQDQIPIPQASSRVLLIGVND